MGTVDWGQYEMPLSLAPALPHSAPREKPVSRPLANPGDRLGAALLDALINVVPVAVAFGAAQGYEEGREITTVRLALWAGLTALIAVIQVTLVSVKGQSLGKVAKGLRIVDYHDDSNPGFRRAVLCRSILPCVIYGIPCFGLLFHLGGLLLIFGPERRCLHDLLAGTKVVEE